MSSTQSSPTGAPVSLPQWLRYQATLHPHRVALRHKRLGLWQAQTWAGLERQTAQLAAGLGARGLGAGSVLLLLTHPRTEALPMVLAAQALGASVVPVDPDWPDAHVAALLRLEERAFVFAEVQNQVERVLAVLPAPVLLAYADARGLGRNQHPALVHVQALAAQAAADATLPDHADPAAGAFSFYRVDPAHGLQWQSFSHAALLAQGRHVAEQEALVQTDEALVARGFATAGHVRYLLAPWLMCGFTLNFPENLATRDADRRELQPTVVLGTQASYARLGDLVRARWPLPGSWHARLLDWALDARRAGVALALAERAVRQPLRRVLGFGRLRVALLAGAPVDEPTGSLLRSLGVQPHAWPEAHEWQAPLEGAIRPAA